jgi:hypothetical protein
LARLSLLLALLSMFSGCIVEDPPPYTKPTKTPPRLDLRLAQPPPDRIIVVDRRDPIPFRLPFASEDGGEKVQAWLFRDYLAGDNALVSVEVPGSTLDDLDRKIEITYPGSAAIPFGCHRIMIRVSHADNFNIYPFGDHIDEADVAEAYWWINAIDVAAGDDGSLFKNCATTETLAP